jgi:ribonuclease P protein component
MTFRKKEHILKSGDFRTVYKRGRSFKRDGFALSILGNALGYNRIGFSISSTNVRRAASRNRIRRLFREAYRINKAAFKMAYDIVIIAKKDPGKRFSYVQAAEALTALARDAKVLS